MGEWIIVDRIDNDIATCELEGRAMQMLPLSILPPDVAEGDCLMLENGSYQIDEMETMRRRQYNIELMRRIMDDSSEP